MQITQAQAAKKLGWTQGAFSQYLNNLTVLNAAAVIKLANFLGVDPKEIDPDINAQLPNLHKLEIRFRLSDPDTRLRGATTYNEISPGLFTVLVDKPIPHLPALPLGTLIQCYPENAKPLVKTTEIKSRIYLVRCKASDEFEVVDEDNCPPKTSLKSKWLVNAFLLH